MILNYKALCRFDAEIHKAEDKLEVVEGVLMSDADMVRFLYTSKLDGRGG